MPFKLHSKGRRHIPRQRHRVTNWRGYDAALRNRGSLTIWFTPDAIAGWKAQPRTTPGGQRHYSDLAIETALTLRAVFRLALRQSEGLIASIMGLLEIDLPIPDHTTLSRRACGLPICKSARIGTGELHLIVDSTGLKLRGAGEWLFEKHGTTKRRSRRKLHIGIDGDSGEIVAFDLTNKDVDDASHVEALLDQLAEAPASFMADGAYDRSAVFDAVLTRNPNARFIVPPCKGPWPGQSWQSLRPSETYMFLQSMRTGGQIGRRRLAITSVRRSRRR
jgi:Transposase DDE domain